jgi:hypothetical protein
LGWFLRAERCGFAALRRLLVRAMAVIVIVDVDNDGVIEDRDSVVLVDNRRAAVTDTAFGKQEINHAWDDTHISQADASSGYSQAMELQLRGKAQDFYTQPLQGAA